MPFSARLLAVVAALQILGSYAVNVPLPISPPVDSKPLARTLFSFSIEADTWPDWSGTKTRNEFTYNALKTLGDLTSQPPKFRVGADSEDHTYWSPTATYNDDEFPPANTITPYPEATRVTVGDEYYEVSKFLPRGTVFTWGVNLGANNLTNAVNVVNAIMRAFRKPAVKESGVILDLIEVGNEPDLYSSNGQRSATNWTVEDYVSDWESIAGPVAEAAGIQSKDAAVSLQGAAFATQKMTPSQIFDLGILTRKPGSAISVISQHRYSAAFCEGGDFPLTSFMSKTAVRGNLSVFYTDIAATKSRGLRYVLGETNSIACHGAPGVSNTAGIALWAIDYTLQAASMGVDELFFHHGVGYKYNFIQPATLTRDIVNGSTLATPLAPHIQPGYYAGLVVNTLIGKTGSSKIAEVPVDDPNVTGYAAFENGALVRAVFVNLYSWLQSNNGTRPSVHIDLEFVKGTGLSKEVDSSWNKKATAMRLVVNHADDTSNLTWAGQTYETSDVSPKGHRATESVVLSKGLDLYSSEAVLIEF